MAIPPKLPARNSNAMLPREVLVALSYGQQVARHGAMLVPIENGSRVIGLAALGLTGTDASWNTVREKFSSLRPADGRSLDALLRKVIVAADSSRAQETPSEKRQTRAHPVRVVQVVPGPGFKISRTSEETRAMLLHDTDVAYLIEERVLSLFYGLTRIEASIASRLIEGKTREESAAELGIPAATITTHLKRILLKVETFRPMQPLVRCHLTVD